METRIRSRLYCPDIEVDGAPDVSYGNRRKMQPQVVSVSYLKVEDRGWYVMNVEVTGQHRDAATKEITARSHTSQYPGQKDKMPEWVWDLVEQYRPQTQESEGER